MFRWYVINTYSGHENKVKANLEHRVKSMNQEMTVRRVVVPTESVVETKDGQKVQTERRLWPGYVLVNMDLTDEAWTLVKNTPGVTGFVGAQNKPVPLSQPEVDRMLHTASAAPAPKQKAEFSLGESVKVISGPLSDFDGEIAEINEDQGKLKVLVSIFERQVPVELGVRQGQEDLAHSRAWEPGAGPAHAPLRRQSMAKKVIKVIKLQIPAGQANPAPPVGPALGQHGVNIMDFCKAFNAETQGPNNGQITPVEISVYEDRSFTFITKTPPAAVLIKEALNLQSGSGEPNRTKVGTISRDQLRAIAERKMPDLNANDVEAAMNIVAGTARSMGVEVGR